MLRLGRPPAGPAATAAPTTRPARRVTVARTGCGDDTRLCPVQGALDRLGNARADGPGNLGRPGRVDVSDQEVGHPGRAGQKSSVELPDTPGTEQCDPHRGPQIGVAWSTPGRHRPDHNWKEWQFSLI